MKKLLLTAFAVLVLAGCGSSSGKTETKTCSVTQSGMNMDATFTATDDKVTKASVAVKVDASALGDMSKLTDDQKKQMEDMVVSKMGIEEGKGVTLKFDFGEKDITVTVDIDLKEGDKEMLKKLGFDGGTDFKLSDTIKDAEADGATCK